MIKIKNPQLLKWIKEKEDLVIKGREISKEIEAVMNECSEYEAEEKKITANVKPKELGKKAEALKKEINKKIKEFEKLAEKIRDEKLKAIPKEIKTKHERAMEKKEELERNRNKLALKIQKIKDRMVPIIHQEVKPHLKKYEDIQSAEAVGDEVVVKIFSYLKDWKKAWDERKKKQTP
jgi:seryl-tRNA synthetase